VDDEGHLIGYKVLPKGTPVVTSDGVTVGTVAKVLDNEREHIFDGLVVKTADGRIFVDAPEVDRIAERRVTLNVDAGTEFEPWRGWRGRVEHNAKRRVDRMKRNLGR
jgi:hypothetical protein